MRLTASPSLLFAACQSNPIGISMWAAASLSFAFLVCAALPFAARAQEGLKLRLSPDLIDPSKKTRVGAVSFGMADKVTGTMDTDVTLTGNAELRRAGGDVLKADTMHYRQVEDDLFAQGAVRIVRDGNVYTGPEMRIKLDDYSGYFTMPEYFLSGTRNRRRPVEAEILTASSDPLFGRRDPVASNRAGFPGRGTADRALFIDRDHVDLDNPIYTTCRVGNLDWYIKADSMSLDQTTQIGEGTNARIYFKGVPILASPYISFPLDDSRKSGLLPPTVAITSRSGVEILQPWYWNIAPNYDLTLFPKLITARGLQLGADVRYLQPTFNGDFRAEGLPNDRDANGAGRYSLSALHRYNNGAWSGYWNYSKASDNNYFVDFSRTIAVSSQRILPRDAAITYGQPYWYATAHVLRYQTLQDAANPIVPPYEKSPQLLLHGARLDVLGGFDFTIDADATRFIHPTFASGDRFILQPTVSWPILRPGWFITPKLSYNTTHYNVADQPPGTPREFSRSLPIASVDSGLVFERDASLFGRALQQTLEPRLFYVRTPFRDQSKLPNYDSGITDFNFSQLFTENSFGGYDRIADANQVTGAVTTRYINTEDGAEIFRASLGQRFYLSPQRVTLPGGTPIDSKRSDVLAEVSGQIFKSLSVDAGAQYSPIVKGFIRSNVGVSYRPEPTKVINAEYRYRKGDLEQIDLSGQWPLYGNFYGVGRVNYSTRDRKPIEILAGVEYRGCCWVLRVVGSRYVTGTQTATSTLFLQLELNGLARLGSNPLESLKRNVPGYQIVNPPPPQGSPYLNYE